MLLVFKPINIPVIVAWLHVIDPALLWLTCWKLYKIDTDIFLLIRSNNKKNQENMLNFFKLKSLRTRQSVDNKGTRKGQEVQQAERICIVIKLLQRLTQFQTALEETWRYCSFLKPQRSHLHKNIDWLERLGGSQQRCRTWGNSVWR